VSDFSQNKSMSWPTAAEFYGLTDSDCCMFSELCLFAGRLLALPAGTSCSVDTNAVRKTFASTKHPWLSCCLPAALTLQLPSFKAHGQSSSHFLCDWPAEERSFTCGLQAEYLLGGRHTETLQDLRPKRRYIRLTTYT
jgi:hypothetical protein